jgi:hypothetical protein
MDLRPRSHRRSRPRRLSKTGRRIVSVASAVALTAAALMATPAADAAGPSYGYGYVWADSPSTAIGASYTPSTSYQFNSTGRVNTITRTGTGAYSVRFPDFGPRGTALVTAYGGPSARPDDHCKIHRWSVIPPSPFQPNDRLDTVLQVRCFTRTGAPVDSQFTASYTYPEPGMSRAAYLLYDQPGGQPNPNHQYNATGAANEVFRSGVGQYHVRLPGLGLPRGTPRHLQVTAYGAHSDASAYCSGTALYTVQPDAEADVECFSSSGALVDSGFTLSYVETGDILFTPAGSRPMAYTSASCPPDPSGCGLSWPYDKNPSADITLSQLTPGQYAVQMPVSLFGGNVQVTNWFTGGSPSRVSCKVAFWNTFDGVRVNCFDRFGNPPESATFALSFVS